MIRLSHQEDRIHFLGTILSPGAGNVKKRVVISKIPSITTIISRLKLDDMGAELSSDPSNATTSLPFGIMCGLGLGSLETAYLPMFSTFQFP